MSSVTYYPGYAQQQVSDNLIVQTIQNITNANPMVVTTVNPHGYTVGMVVRFVIPNLFGMIQLNGLAGQVIELTSNTLTISINSINFLPFSYPISLPSAYTYPSVIPNNSGVVLTPNPLPYGNQDTFQGAIWNNGAS